MQLSNFLLLVAVITLISNLLNIIEKCQKYCPLLYRKVVVSYPRLLFIHWPSIIGPIACFLMLFIYAIWFAPHTGKIDPHGFSPLP